MDHVVDVVGEHVHVYDTISNVGTILDGLLRVEPTREPIRGECGGTRWVDGWYRRVVREGRIYMSSKVTDGLRDDLAAFCCA